MNLQKKSATKQGRVFPQKQADGGYQWNQGKILEPIVTTCFCQWAYFTFWDNRIYDMENTFYFWVYLDSSWEHNKSTTFNDYSIVGLLFRIVYLRKFVIKDWEGTVIGFLFQVDFQFHFKPSIFSFSLEM